MRFKQRKTGVHQHVQIDKYLAPDLPGAQLVPGPNLFELTDCLFDRPQLLGR